MFSAVHQQQAYTCPLPSKHPSRLPPHPTLLGCHQRQLRVHCIIQQIPTGYLFYIW